MKRRPFLKTLGLCAPSAATPQPGRASQANPLRVAVIGHTGRGNYGHGLDHVWLDCPETRIVAVADAHALRLAAAVKRLDGVRGFADYRRMYEARHATEMIVAVFESHRQGRPVTFPLKNRRNPLTML